MASTTRRRARPLPPPLPLPLAPLDQWYEPDPDDSRGSNKIRIPRALRMFKVTDEPDWPDGLRIPQDRRVSATQAIRDMA